MAHRKPTAEQIENAKLCGRWARAEGLELRESAPWAPGHPLFRHYRIGYMDNAPRMEATA